MPPNHIPKSQLRYIVEVPDRGPGAFEISEHRGFDFQILRNPPRRFAFVTSVLESSAKPLLRRTSLCCKRCFSSMQLQLLGQQQQDLFTPAQGLGHKVSRPQASSISWLEAISNTRAGMLRFLLLGSALEFRVLKPTKPSLQVAEAV